MKNTNAINNTEYLNQLVLLLQQAERDMINFKKKFILEIDEKIKSISKLKTQIDSDFEIEEESTPLEETKIYQTIRKSIDLMPQEEREQMRAEIYKEVYKNKENKKSVAK